MTGAPAAMSTTAILCPRATGSVSVIPSATSSRSPASKSRSAVATESRGSMKMALFAVMGGAASRSEEHTSELQSLMRISYAVFCLKKKKKKKNDMEATNITANKCTPQQSHSYSSESSTPITNQDK